MQLQEYEKEHLATLRRYLVECTVLLKSNGDFPLVQTEKIATFGSGVRNTIKGGTGSGEVNSHFFMSIENVLENAGFTITTKAWLDAYEQVRIEARKEFHKVIKANETHISEHHGLTEDILCSEYGYEGIVMTDWVTGGGVFTKDAKYPAPNASKVSAAGSNLFMPGCTQDYEQVMIGLKDGTVTRKQLEISATKVYRMAKKLSGRCL